MKIRWLLAIVFAALFGSLAQAQEEKKIRLLSDQVVVEGSSFAQVGFQFEEWASSERLRINLPAFYTWRFVGGATERAVWQFGFHLRGYEHIGEVDEDRGPRRPQEWDHSSTFAILAPEFFVADREDKIGGPLWSATLRVLLAGAYNFGEKEGKDADGIGAAFGLELIGETTLLSLVTQDEEVGVEIEGQRLRISKGWLPFTRGRLQALAANDPALVEIDFDQGLFKFNTLLNAGKSLLEWTIIGTIRYRRDEAEEFGFLVRGVMGINQVAKFNLGFGGGNDGSIAFEFGATIQFL